MASSSGKLSDAQVSALLDATKGQLQHYRRGYALTKNGPFHANRTVKALERIGMVSVSARAIKVKATIAGHVQIKTRRD